MTGEKDMVCMDDNEFDPARLEPGVRDVVVFLRSKGIPTDSSCEGGKGHSFPLPTVQCPVPVGQDAGPLRQKIAQVLWDAGCYRTFEVKESYTYVSNPHMRDNKDVPNSREPRDDVYVDVIFIHGTQPPVDQMQYG